MTPRRIVIAGWVVFLLFAWPGFLTTESVDQLGDSRTGNYTDWYAPMLSEIWRLVGHLISGPAGMLLLQSGLFVAGAYGLLRRSLPDRQAAVAAVAILCFPPVAAPLAVIWRDGQLAGLLLAGAAAMLSERRAIRLGGLVLVLLGATMRGGAAIAALPLVLLFFTWKDGAGRWQRRAIAAAAWVVVSLASYALDEGIADTDSDRQELARAQLDIIGVIRFTSGATDASIHAELDRVGLGGLAPPEIRRDVRRLYRFYPSHFEILQVPDQDDARARAALLHARRAMAFARPMAYLKHRSFQLKVLLGLEPAYEWNPVYVTFVEYPDHRFVIRHRASYSLVQSQLIGVADATPAFMFRPYLYAVLALLLVPLAILRRERIAGALLASGLLYELTLGMTLSLPEYRHSHWMIACTMLATVMLAAQELQRRRAGPRPSVATAAAA